MKMINSFGIFSDISIKINGVEFAGRYRHATLFADIFSPAWTLEIRVEDTENLIDKIEIKQMTDVTVTLTSLSHGLQFDTKTLNLRMKIMAITDRIMVNRFNQTYKLVCASIHVADDLNKNVMQHIKSKHVHEAANMIASNYIGGIPLNVHEASNIITCNIVNKSPIESMYWLSKHALDGNRADFLFFQDTPDSLAFKSFQRMYDEGSTKLKVYHVPGNNNDMEIRKKYEVNIEEYKIVDDDNIVSVAGGHQANTFIGVDILKKSVKQRKFNFGDDAPSDIDSFQRTNDNTPSHDSYIKTRIVTDPFDTGNSIAGSTIDQSTSRVSALYKMNRNRLVAVQWAACDMFSYLGSPVRIELKDNDGRQLDARLDPRTAGRHVVAAIAMDFKPHIQSRMRVEYIKLRNYQA